MKSPFGNMGNILKQAQAMQEQMAKIQEQAASKTASGTAGGGIVTVTALITLEDFLPSPISLWPRLPAWQILW